MKKQAISLLVCAGLMVPVVGLGDNTVIIKASCPDFGSGFARFCVETGQPELDGFMSLIGGTNDGVNCKPTPAVSKFQNNCKLYLSPGSPTPPLNTDWPTESAQKFCTQMRQLGITTDTINARLRLTKVTLPQAPISTNLGTCTYKFINENGEPGAIIKFGALYGVNLPGEPANPAEGLVKKPDTFHISTQGSFTVAPFTSPYVQGGNWVPGSSPETCNVDTNTEDELQCAFNVTYTPTPP